MSCPSSVLASDGSLGQSLTSFGHCWPRAGRSKHTNKRNAAAINPAVDFMFDILCAAARLPAKVVSDCSIYAPKAIYPSPVSLELMRYTTQFLLSALAAEQFPAPDVPEIAFLGRSNVGKSSLLNELVGEKAAKVSSTPGRTRAINFFALLDPKQRRKLVFADLPGYGYAKISKSISAGWPAFIEPYLAIQIGRGSFS